MNDKDKKKLREKRKKALKNLSKEDKDRLYNRRIGKQKPKT